MMCWTKRASRFLLLTAVIALGNAYADTWTDPNTGITWTYVVQGGCAQLQLSFGEFGRVPTIPITTKGAITIPSKLGGCPVTSIGEFAFEKCSGLTSVTIPSSVISIAQQAFYGCSGLISVTIPSSVTSIGPAAFRFCGGITSYIVDNGNPCYQSVNGLLLSKDGKELIAGVKGDIVIPSSVTSIGDSAFCGCLNGLESVTIPSSVTNIGCEAFSGCSGLTSVTIPSSVISIGANVFEGCSGLISIVVDDQSPYYKTVKGLLLSKDGKDLIAGVNGNVVIPSSVTNICEWAFYCREGLTSVTMPSSVVSIGGNAFCGCDWLTSVTIPASVTSIDRTAFYGDRLTLVEFEGLPPNDLVNTALDRNVELYYNSAYEKEWAAAIAECGFVNASPYTPVFDGGPYKEIVDGVEWTYMVQDRCAQIGFGSFNCSSSAVPITTIGAISIPSTLGRRPVTSVGMYAFYRCSNLTSVTMPPGITNIGWEAFAECVALTNVDIPVSVEVISGGAFAGCKSLEAIVVPGNVCCIGEQAAYVQDPYYSYYFASVGAFERCTSLRSIVIGEGVQEIGFRAFKKCRNLQSVVLPDSLRNIRAGAFSECVKLNRVDLPRRLSSLGDGVVSQDDGVFFRCVGLNDLVVPASVSWLGDYAFAGCTSLKTLRFEGDEPIVSGWCVLPGTPKDLIVEVHDDTLGWYNAITYERLAKWQGRTLLYDGQILASTKELSEDDRYQLRNNLLSTLEALKKTGVTLSEARKYEYLQWAMNIAEDCPSASETAVEFATELGVCLSDIQKTSLVDWGMAIVQNQASGGYAIIQQYTNNVMGASSVNLTVTNVVVHYVLNSIQPEIAVPITPETGIVSVMTEVKGGNMAIPDSWASNYPSFESKFGSDFTKALMMSSGKVDAAGNEMFVWQDYVAGTDPTDPDDKFTASITIVDGVPVVSYTPELSAEQAALRIYKTFGKAKLQDADWVEVPRGHEADYNFFKVTVEMK